MALAATDLLVVPRCQRWAAGISLLNALLLGVLGSAFVLMPMQVLQIFVGGPDPDNEDRHVDSTLLQGILRMTGSVMMALALGFGTLLYPCLFMNARTVTAAVAADVWNLRTGIALQSLTGLLWIGVGLLDDRMCQVDHSQYDGPCTASRIVWGLLVIGFIVFMVGCLGFLTSFWPVMLPLANTSESMNGDGTGDLTEPLLPIFDEQTPIDNPQQLEQQEVEPTQQDDNEQVHGDNQSPTSRIQGTRRLFKLAAPQLSYLYVGCIVLLIRLPFSLCIPHFVSTTIGALSRSEFDSARQEVFWLFLLGTVDALLDFGCIYFFGVANQKIVRGVRIDTFAAILKQDLAFFDRHTTGELTSRLTADCGELSGDLTWFFRFSIESVVRITGITTYMLVRSPKLGAVTLSIVPIIAAVNKVYGEWLGDNAKKVQDALAAANSVAQESLSCIRTVIAFASENEQFQQYVERINEQFRLNVRQTYMTGIYYMLISTFLINTIVQGTLLLVGSYMIQRGNLTSEILLSFMLYQGQLSNEMMNLFNSYSSLIKSTGAGDKVFELLDRKPPPPATGSQQVVSHEGNAIPTSNDQPVSIRFEKVQFFYPSRPEQMVLRGLDLNIPAGSTVALCGPSGCGKSTIVGLCQRFYDATMGRVLIDGVDIQSFDLKVHRQRIGVVSQDPTLLSGSILTNITYGCSDATRDDAIEAAKRANADEFICSFPEGYSTEVGERGVQLSGGQKQRIAISRAIVRHPALLLLDEATSALDADSEQIVQSSIDSLLKQSKGITTIIVAHRLQTVRNADMIAVLNEGRIIEIGPHNELMRLEGYYRGMVDKSTGGKLVV